MARIFDTYYSTLPIVEPGKEFNITGILVDKINLETIANSDISFLYESASQAIPPSSLEAIDKQSADTGGMFNAKTNSPHSQGKVSVTTVYNGSGLYHSVALDLALVIVSNSTGLQQHHPAINKIGIRYVTTTYIPEDSSSTCFITFLHFIVIA
jgi:hypothetical protein